MTDATSPTGMHLYPSVNPSLEPLQNQPSTTEPGWHWVPVIGTVGSLALLVANLGKAIGLGFAARVVGTQDSPSLIEARSAISKGLRNAGFGVAKYGIGLLMSLALTLVGVFYLLYLLAKPKTIKGHEGPGAQ
jgi:hypothetical protein